LIFITWWTGRGYYTLPILVASMVVFELARAAFHLPDGFWVFGFALIGASPANWFAGRKLNRQSLKKVRTRRVRERLFYRAQHKFVSVPMETFSVPMEIAGVAVLVAAAIVTFSPLVAQDRCLDGGGAWHEGRCDH
jgi:hypothetical protein